MNDAPWPVADRDAITLNVISQNQVTLVVTIGISGVPDFVPTKPGLVRVEKLKGFWQFSPLENGIVEVVYQVHNEPGGNLSREERPRWINIGGKGEKQTLHEGSHLPCNSSVIDRRS